MWAWRDRRWMLNHRDTKCTEKTNTEQATSIIHVGSTWMEPHFSLVLSFSVISVSLWLVLLACQWLNMNSLEFNIAQNTSSRACCLFGFASTAATSFFISASLGG